MSLCLKASNEARQDKIRHNTTGQDKTRQEEVVTSYFNQWIHHDTQDRTTTQHTTTRTTTPHKTPQTQHNTITRQSLVCLVLAWLVFCSLPFSSPLHVLWLSCDCLVTWLFRLLLSFLAFSCLAFSCDCLVSSCFVVFCLSCVLFCYVVPCRALPCPVLPCLRLSVLSCLVSSGPPLAQIGLGLGLNLAWLDLGMASVVSVTM